MQPEVYIVAVRGEAGNSVDPHWVDQVREIAGLKIQAETPDQAVVLAPRDAIARLRAKLGRNFIVEQQTTRQF